MDPRYRRSREALRAAVLEIAASAPLSEASVAGICRAAGVTRDTFYRHAASPVELLADTLGDLIGTIVHAEQDPTGGIRLPDGFHRAEHALLTHVAEHAAIYRNAMQPQLAAPLRANLEREIRDVLVAHLHGHPASVPEGVDPSDEDALVLVAAYAASGTVGAIEVWLRDDPLDVDRGVRLILAASPAFWFGADAGADGGVEADAHYLTDVE